MKNVVLYSIVMIVLMSCGGHDVNSIKKTTIAFENPHRRYNPVLKGAILNMSYKIFNTGETPLVISEVQTSCSCVVQELSNNVIGAGEHGFINLKFDSNKNIGYVKQYITVIANVDAVFTNNITFETNVIPDAHYVKDYEEVYFSNNEIKDYSKSYIVVEE